MENKLYRSRRNRVFLGVCGGIGEYFGIDPVIIRLIFIFSVLFLGPLSLLFYILCALVIPENPGNSELPSPLSKDGGETLGWVFLALGVYFLGRTFGIFQVSFTLVLALLFILFGILIFFKK
ncbi:PspC domain-containing protein [Dictyoglomus thermophilum]|uniref:PspC domain family n=1 Tax=Dictyoglomus thermophilum (strain ATCC 35947 / DSM 3960 / H-6-12) TaxID=309799 RepID=B5YCX1_DICT6|nr:PspC domain-containing protein [Dictyoglomus thermophilum]ACI18584.1 PspC domain family [Dictyoglomus thermophilum H-6-12]